MNSKASVNPTSIKWLAEDEQIVADYFLDLGLRSLKEILDMRVFDLMNMQGLDAVRVNVWWKGARGHEWVAPVCNRLRQYGAGCPYCAGRRLLRGFNDLATKFPDVAAEWSGKISLKRRTMCCIFKSKGVVAGEVWPRMACSYRRQVKRTWLSLLFIEEGSGRV